MNERAFFEGLGVALCKTASPVVPPSAPQPTPVPSAVPTTAPSPATSALSNAFDNQYAPFRSHLKSFVRNKLPQTELPAPRVQPPKQNVLTKVTGKSVAPQSTIDVLQPVQGQSNSYYLDGIVRSRPETDEVLGGKVRTLPPPSQPNTLSVNAHGGGPTDEFKLQAEQKLWTEQGDRIVELGHPTSYGDIAQKIGPGTNQIHNINSIACNGDGGCTPEMLRQYFPNVTNVVQTPPHFYGAMLPEKQRSPSLRFLHQSGALTGDFVTPEPSSPQLSTTELLRHLNKEVLGYRPGPLATIPHRYLLEKDKWVDKGRMEY